MKVQINTKSNGSVLMIGLVTSTIILASLASYLLLVSNESQSVTRDQDWNTCVPVMEAGVEEALTQIRYCGTNLANLSSNNWTLGADGNYHKTPRAVGTNGSYCAVTIQPVQPPVIYSEGYTVAPLCATNYLVREVRVTTKIASPYGGGLTSKAGIVFKGTALFDSYNSSKGPYNPLIHGTNAVALTDTNSVGAISAGGGGAIYGMAVTGPGGTVALNGGASVGDTNWVPTPGVEPGWSADDANVQFDDEAAPYTSGTPPTWSMINGTNTCILNGILYPHFYLNGSLNMQSFDTLVVTGNVTLYVTGTIKLTGSAQIIITPGSSLNLYAGGSISIGGQGVWNQTQAPSHFILHGLPTCTSVAYSGGDSFYGVANAPEASFSFQGGSGAYGAFVANDITVAGQGGVHYDEALRGIGNYVMNSWDEITPQ